MQTNLHVTNVRLNIIPIIKDKTCLWNTDLKSSTKPKRQFGEQVSWLYVCMPDMNSINMYCVIKCTANVKAFFVTDRHKDMQTGQSLYAHKNLILVHKNINTMLSNTSKCSHLSKIIIMSLANKCVIHAPWAYCTAIMAIWLEFWICFFAAGWSWGVEVGDPVQLNCWN